MNHRAIQRQENKNIRNEPCNDRDKLDDIDPFYLEAFSLIYQKSPYELVGVKNPHLICPMASLNDLAPKCTGLIVRNLFDKNDPDKLAYLETITKIGKLKTQKYKKLISFLKDTSIGHVFEIDPCNYLSEKYDTQQVPQHPLSLEPNLYLSNDYHQSYILWDACLLLNDLERHNPMRLHTLAQLSLCDEKCAKALRGLMLDLGYPNDARSLHNYHVDKVLSPPKKRRKTKLVEGKYIWITVKPKYINKEPQNIVFYYPNRSLTGILEEGEILVHNNSSHSSIHGYSAKLTEFLLTLSYTSKIPLAAVNDITQAIGREETQYDTSKADVIYKINLQDGHIYSNEGMALLTEDQSDKIQRIITSVFAEGVYRDTLPIFFERKLILQEDGETV